MLLPACLGDTEARVQIDPLLRESPDPAPARAVRDAPHVPAARAGFFRRPRSRINRGRSRGRRDALFPYRYSLDPGAARAAAEGRLRVGRAVHGLHRRDGHRLCVELVSAGSRARPALGRLPREPRPRQRALAAHRLPRAADRGAIDLRAAGNRVLQPGPEPARRARRRSGDRHVRRGRRHARVRPPRRGAPLRRAVGRDRLRHEALGVVRERLRADGRRPAPSGRRDRAAVHAESRRGVRRELPRPERAPGRTGRGALGCRVTDALSGRHGTVADPAGRPHAVDREHDADAQRLVHEEGNGDA